MVPEISILAAVFPLLTAVPPGGASVVMTPEEVIILLATKVILPLTEAF